MKQSLLLLSLFLTVLLQGCAVAGGIFKAGIWVGVLAVVVIIVVILAIVSKSRK